MARFLLAPAVFDLVGIGVISGAFGFAAGACSPCPSHDPILVSIDRCWNATPVPGLPPREIQGRYRAFAVPARRGFALNLRISHKLCTVTAAETPWGFFVRAFAKASTRRTKAHPLGQPKQAGGRDEESNRSRRTFRNRLIQPHHGMPGTSHLQLAALW